MTAVRVEHENETSTGWTHAVTLTLADGSVQELTVTLSFQDYEYWSGGVRPPERVTESLIECLLEPDEDAHIPDPLPARFDASTARRWMPGLDACLRSGSWH